MANYSKIEVATGALVVAIAAAFMIYAGQVTGVTNSRSGYELTASFRSLEGVSVGTDIRLSGIKIGSVTDISLNPENYRIDAKFRVQNDVDIPEDSAAIVTLEGLFGGNFVEILPGGSLMYLAAGDEILDTQSPVSLLNLMMRFVDNDDSPK
ncbi:MAG: outer membrane lipid asymmetry maintenance protein MlaD [Aestuariivita sp.]|nr:outer membrane lipid asymmetry maintenance protein MlaD [Aestuariivita sp.]MCY4345534.1 outer membrane lipid asymmetry maintenance protein MlaD [Aestuariivita sp.]